MSDRLAWPFLLTVAALLPVAGIAVRAAQPPAAPAAQPGPVSEPTSADVPSSTVSPVIERFMAKSGQRVATMPPPALNLVPLRARGTSAAALPSSTIDRSVRGAQAPAPAPAPLGTSPSLLMDDIGDEKTDSPASRRSPLEFDMKLKSAPFAATDFRFPINLASALQLSDARPLIVASAQVGVWAAEADLVGAKVLWLPGINLAADYLRHDGGGPDFNKGVLTSVSTNFFYAGGGLYGIIPTTDAIFEPMRARQMLSARNYDVQAAKNDALLQTTDAYFMVHEHRGKYAGALYCVDRGKALVEEIATLSRDMVPKFEVDRARNMVADLGQRAVSARQRWRVRSADLTQVLRLDPRSVVDPLEEDHLQITLIDPGRPLEDLMMIAIANRPEIASRRALIKAAEVAIRREKGRMLLPTLYLTGFQSPGGMLIQGGIFSLGPNSSLNQWAGRADVSVQLMWQFESFGIGNLARIKNQRGQQSLAITDLYAAQDMVAADVTRALARVQSAAARVLKADRSLRTGLITYNGQVEGLKQISRFGNVLVLINRPQETIYALQLLNLAFEEYFATVAEYNRAQFDLFHALGYPAQEVTTRRPPGEVLPVNTARPDFLPWVGHGPPPATR